MQTNSNKSYAILWNIVHNINWLKTVFSRPSQRTTIMFLVRKLILRLEGVLKYYHKKNIKQSTSCQKKSVTKERDHTVPQFRKGSCKISLVMCRLSLYICQAENVCTEWVLNICFINLNFDWLHTGHQLRHRYDWVRLDMTLR